MRTLITGAVVLGIDLLTKWAVQKSIALHQMVPIIPGFFDLTYILNPGAAFGLFPGQRWLFYLVSAVAIGLILYYHRKPEIQVGWLPFALGLMLGGAVGNLLDRIRYGKVVDFLYFHYKEFYWPAFNVADMAIVSGVGLFILHMMTHPDSAAVSHD